MSAKSWPLAIVFGVVGGAATLLAGVETLMLAGAINLLMGAVSNGSGGIGAVSANLIEPLIAMMVPMFLVYRAGRAGSPRPSRLLVRGYWILTLVLVMGTIFGGFSAYMGPVPVALLLVAILLALQSIASLWATLTLVRHYSS